MTEIIKKFFSLISGKSCHKKPYRPVEHYAVYQFVPEDNNASSHSWPTKSDPSYQIKYGWHKSTAKKMKVGDYAFLPEPQSAGLYQGILSIHGDKSAKTKAVPKENHLSIVPFRKVTRIK
jgi:hypothetical protein|tara:strand:+ start:1725 stop:2084 length:360 start_codon:yes stop_codon:yes gene_type:complete